MVKRMKSGVPGAASNTGANTGGSGSSGSVNKPSPPRKPVAWGSVIGASVDSLGRLFLVVLLCYVGWDTARRLKPVEAELAELQRRRGEQASILAPQTPQTRAPTILTVDTSNTLRVLGGEQQTPSRINSMNNNNNNTSSYTPGTAVNNLFAVSLYGPILIPVLVTIAGVLNVLCVLWCEKRGILSFIALGISSLGDALLVSLGRYLGGHGVLRETRLLRRAMRGSWILAALRLLFRPFSSGSSAGIAEFLFGVPLVLFLCAHTPRLRGARKTMIHKQSCASTMPILSTVFLVEKEPL